MRTAAALVPVSWGSAAKRRVCGWTHGRQVAEVVERLEHGQAVLEAARHAVARRERMRGPLRDGMLCLRRVRVRTSQVPASPRCLSRRPSRWPAACRHQLRPAQPCRPGRSRRRVFLRLLRRPWRPARYLRARPWAPPRRCRQSRRLRRRRDVDALRGAHSRLAGPPCAAWLTKPRLHAWAREQQRARTAKSRESTVQKSGRTPPELFEHPKICRTHSRARPCGVCVCRLLRVTVACTRQRDSRRAQIPRRAWPLCSHGAAQGGQLPQPGASARCTVWQLRRCARLM